jgi:hypothetical protein
MLGQANSFAYVANATYMDLMKNRGPNKPIVAAPFVVNAAFSVEWYLKTLHVTPATNDSGHARFSGCVRTRRDAGRLCNYAD